MPLWPAAPAYLKPKPHRISRILIWWHFNILPWWLFSNIYFPRSGARPPWGNETCQNLLQKNKNVNTSAVLAVIHTIAPQPTPTPPLLTRQGSQTLICFPPRNESVWWLSDLWVSEHTLQIQFNPWLLVLWRTWENVLLKFNTRSFLLPPMQTQRYAYMTPSLACANGSAGKAKRGEKWEQHDCGEKQKIFMHESHCLLQVLLNTNPISPPRHYTEHLRTACVCHHDISLSQGFLWHFAGDSSVSTWTCFRQIT